MNSQVKVALKLSLGNPMPQYQQWKYYVSCQSYTLTEKLPGALLDN
jgi:hypothetical protein